MTNAFTARIHEAARGLPDIGEAWRACLAACPPEQRLYSHAWYESWLETHGARAPWLGRTRVAVAYDPAGAPRAILPLVYRRSEGLTYLSLAGNYQPLRSFPCVPDAADAACRAIVAALLREGGDWDVLRMGPVDTASPERAALVRACDAAFRRRVAIPRGRTFVNRLAPTFEAYARSSTGKRCERYARRFAREPGASIRHFESPAPDDAARMYADLASVEQRSWLATRGGHPRFMGDVAQAFWRRVTETSLAPGRHLDAWIAYVGPLPVGFRFVIRSVATDYVIANQYDEQYGEFRLGWILYMDHLRLATRRGTRVLDMDPGDAHYKDRLGGEEADLRVDMVYFRDSAKGIAGRALLAGLLAAREKLRRTPWGRRLAERLPRV
jgi:CelD/BcsL family acetyltransferase involved in cellulose biosynthesis